MTSLDGILKSKDYFTNKGPSSQSYGFSSSHVWMWELDHKEGWAAKNWCFWTVVLEKILESRLDCKEIKPVHPKGNQSWIFTGRTDAKVEATIVWLPDVTSQLIRKDPDAGQDWRQEEKGTTEDKMVGWHHWLNRHEFEQAPGDGEGQGSLACCSPWVTKSWTQLSDWTTTTTTKVKSQTLHSSCWFCLWPGAPERERTMTPHSEISGLITGNSLLSGVTHALNGEDEGQQCPAC